MIKLVVYDFDGVMTDNRVWVSQDGVESVACNRSDGWWIKKITERDIEQVILTTELNPVVKTRGKKLNLEVYQAPQNKLECLQKIAQQRNLSFQEICYVGNDLNDLECIRAVGLPLAPKDAQPEILALSTALPVIGGAGIVRHVYDLLCQKPLALERSIPPVAIDVASLVQQTIEESIDAKRRLLDSKEALTLIQEIASRSIQALKNGNKILLAGNGGSFADSMHIAAEFVSKLCKNRIPLSALALGCSNSNLTAIGNDYGYEHTFARELSAVGRPGDIFIAISTSGASPNVLEAVRVGREKGIHCYGLSGRTGGKLKDLCPTLLVPSDDTARIQECHILVGHILCQLIESPFLN